MRNYDARRLSTAVKMLFNIEMLLTAVSYGRSNFYNIDYSLLTMFSDDFYIGIHDF